MPFIFTTCYNNCFFFPCFDEFWRTHSSHHGLQCIVHQVSAAQTGNGKKSLSWWERSATKPQLLSLLPVRRLIIISHGFAVIRCVSPSSSWTKHDKPKYNIILLLHYISFIQIYPSDIPIIYVYIYIYPSDPSGICQYNHRKSRCYGTPLGSLRYCSPS